jgi:hypothetical protein
MPPPERVIPDKRRKVVEREAEREAREGERRAGNPAPDVQPKRQRNP